MADEQDDWLDADAAEAFLRGDRAEPGGAHDRTAARRLDAALRAVRTPRPPAGELPGEEAVLAAFREASGAAAGKRADPTRATGPAGRQDTLHTVRIGPGRTTPSRRLRWTRPVRYGLAVSLAGCALGGVAVAGGTGMLPAPFGGQGAPVPASSVSTTAPPRELGAELPDTDPSARPSGPAGTASPPATPGAPEGADPQDGGAPDGDPAGGGGTRGDGDADPGHGSPDGTAEPDGREETGGSTGATDPSSGASGGDSPAEAYKKSLQVCRSYRDDSLGGEERRRLVELARGERNVKRFCARLLDRLGGGGASGDDEGPGGRPGGPDGDDGKRSLPSVVFHTVRPAEGRVPPSDEPSAPVVAVR
ncbi:hypothetical protein [Streptomyces sp. NRRL WC-3549]|uniref:hypothetical protein n=1 Tax=Streptomyces sp. NRRL WC-3549 TaxID=1463925 RepID=UPI0004C7F70A|nr:hypothetical protein [Streptomyces sp. NRRL WC-3549]